MSDPLKKTSRSKRSALSHADGAIRASTPGNLKREWRALAAAYLADLRRLDRIGTERLRDVDRVLVSSRRSRREIGLVLNGQLKDVKRLIQGDSVTLDDLRALARRNRRIAAALADLVSQPLHLLTRAR